MCLIQHFWMRGREATRKKHHADAKSDAKDAASNAESILQRVEVLQASGYDIRPDLITYNSALDAWAKSSEYEAASRAEALLLRNAVSFTSVIDAFAKCLSVDGPRKAEAIWRLIEKTYLEGNKDAEPNTVSCGTARHQRLCNQVHGIVCQRRHGVWHYTIGIVVFFHK